MPDLLNLPVPIGILFEVFRNQGWKITVSENWGVDPTIIAIASRSGHYVSVNGAKAPAAQAMAVTAIAHLQYGSFYDIAEPDNGYPAICEKDLSQLWGCERRLIKAYWESIQTVLDAVATYNRFDGKREENQVALSD